MDTFDPKVLKQLYIPESASHKGQNGKVMVIGGSKLFHAASLWALEIASKIVDMVFYSSVDENNHILLQAKTEWKNGIVVPRGKIDDYMKEADAVLIGPGLPRENGIEEGDDDTLALTTRLLSQYPDKKWVIDGGSLQVIKPTMLPKNCIVTPHHQEFQTIFGMEGTEESAKEMAAKYGCVVILKGEIDTVCSPKQCVRISGGNAGMTKGGTGDVLAGLTVALFAKNDAFIAAQAASFFNKKAGESLFEKVGLYFNSSDLVEEIPRVMKKYLLA